MPSFATQRTIVPHHPLIAHGRPDAIAAYRRGKPVGAGQFLRDVERTASLLPASTHLLNFFTDRYRFAVTFCAAIVRGQLTLLPPTTTPNVIASMRAFAPDVYYVSDDPATPVDLPRCEIAFADSEDGGNRFDIPVVPADRAVACVFTSGSTGEPQPHFKAWGSLVRDMAAGCARMGVGPGHAVLGTVPPQHMYGFESTVMLPLLSGAALTSERPYYPADIDEAISRVPPRRILYTTPFHLRNWLAQGEAAHLETIVSATAPLPVSLALEAERLTGARVYEIYGCTEAGQVATRRPTCSEEWQALDGVRLWNQDGQAMVEGGHIDEPTPLQDVIDVSANGTHFTLGGRIGDMVNIAGKRNSLGYLNHHLTAIPGVVDGVFFLPDDPEPGRVTRLTAFVVAPGLTASDIRAGLRERIDPAFLPRPLYMLDRLPREATGKITRDALKALATKSPARGDS